MAGTAQEMNPDVLVALFTNTAPALAAVGALATTGLCLWIAWKQARFHLDVKDAIALIRALKNTQDMGQ